MVERAVTVLRHECRAARPLCAQRVLESLNLPLWRQDESSTGVEDCSASKCVVFVLLNCPAHRHRTRCHTSVGDGASFKLADRDALQLKTPMQLSDGVQLRRLSQRIVQVESTLRAVSQVETHTEAIHVGHGGEELPFLLAVWCTEAHDPLESPLETQFPQIHCQSDVVLRLSLVLCETHTLGGQFARNCSTAVVEGRERIGGGNEGTRLVSVETIALRALVLRRARAGCYNDRRTACVNDQR
mmetsp:Transcript_59198/g.157579  ORF Transcript_59198/g.157579 Transcript_59198/m.157579 type:complete len:243 (-) Transcript_59198:219-947(-)